jgi:hypothetical protein
MSSVINDLKKFAGPIKAKPLKDDELIIHIDTIQPQKNPSEKNDTVDKIATMIIPPLTVLYNNGKIIHDKTTLSAKCTVGHLHKYFLKDIVDTNSAGGVTNCKTCNVGTKFIIMVRTTIESVLNVPFMLTTNLLAKSENAIPVEFTNPLMKIQIACYPKIKNVNAADSSSKVDDYLLIEIHHTTSLKKIRETLHKHLLPMIHLFNPTVTKNINDLTNHKLKPPLPYTQEHANDINKDNNVKLKIVDGTLFDF